MKHTPCLCSEATGQFDLPLTSQGLPFPVSLSSFLCWSTTAHSPRAHVPSF